MTRIEIPTRDGLILGANLFKAELAQPVKGGVIINSATGVKQSFYGRFASFLASQGYHVITYDYRGIGESCTLPLNDTRLSMKAWGELDFAAVIDQAVFSYPDINWHCIGHSVGGQIIGLADNHHKLASTFGIAAQSGNWRNWPFKYKLSFAPTCYVLIPMLSHLLGYFPGSIMGGEHLPKGVAVEWARWCRNRHYISDKEGKPYRPFFSDVNMPMRFLVLDDDHQFAPEKAVRALAGFYSAANMSIEKTTPEERQHSFLGHFGFFRPKHEERLWFKVIDWLSNWSEKSTVNMQAALD